jgi:predicted phosphodiesterase
MLASEYPRYQCLKGNHEGAAITNLPGRIELDNNVFLEHGHRFFWSMIEQNPDKISRWESKRFKGISHKRWLAMLIAHKFDEAFGRGILRPTEKLKAALYEYTDKKLKHQTIICGHKHVKELFDHTFEYADRSVRFICLPRGINAIDI